MKIEYYNLNKNLTTQQKILLLIFLFSTKMMKKKIYIHRKIKKMNIINYTIPIMISTTQKMILQSFLNINCKIITKKMINSLKI